MENVNSEVVKQLQNENKKILIDFWGTFCGPCKSLIPLLEKIEKNHPNVTFVKVDIQKNMDLVGELGITSVPTVMIYNGVELIDKSVGVKPESYYNEILK